MGAKVFLILFFDVVKSLPKGCSLSRNLTFNKLLVIIVRNRRCLLLKTVYFFMLVLLYKDFTGVKLKNIDSMRFLYQKARDPTLHQTNLTAPAVHRVARLLQAYSRVVTTPTGSALKQSFIVPFIVSFRQSPHTYDHRIRMCDERLAG